ncbi:putative intracellular protease/amidase [Psychromicrobium silvestre]|uniref:Putative intracellular protease/amidase n=1 Tax=Psychromicrobium silvestre TaxID=1645614 RepID=A0A7Y9LSK6_9MICC|nr:DJ-1/PfpI family protein [Psychromicrobium silvestre]NYE94827.1 putative intracellular protease/amidase [Psychromicrobium silvestre]
MNRPLSVVVYLPEKMADWEVGYLMAELKTGRFLRAGVKLNLTTAAKSREAVPTMGGLSLVPEQTLAELDEQNIDALILPGGESWADIAAEQEVLGLATRLKARGVPIAAICGATEALAAVGLLNDVAHTSNSPDFLKSFKEYRGAELYRNEFAVRDNHVITAGSWAPVELAAQVFAELEVMTESALANWLLFWADREVSGIYGLAAEQGRRSA